ncbi:MAG: hypothetical protein M3M89_07175, partial [Thermoproteota archaeon]|nr:hypothetical protein [Thermoproteota archaeon]
APLALVKHNDNGIFSDIVDARNFFSSLTELVSIHYVGGDGQEALPNNKLSAPLRVGVTIGKTPLTDLRIRGVKVRFSLDPGGGTLGTSPGETEKYVSPNANGVAECNWDLTGAQQQQQRVTAELYICEKKIVDIPSIHFTATLPVLFYYIQGDGQEAGPGNKIKLQVGLKIGSTTIPTGPSGYQVKFVPTDGSVTSSDLVPFNGDGIAETTWTVGHNFFDQQVVATLYYDKEETNLQKIKFNVRLPLSFYYVRGDGERALPGDKVEIEAGIRVKAGIQLPDDIEFQIRFSITEGSGGSLADSMNDALPSAADNTYASAKTTWTLGYEDMLLRQQAKAELYFSRKIAGAGPSWIPANLPPIFFNAMFPLSFYYIEGDGVEAPPGTDVRLAVGLALGSKPVQQGYSVRFSLLHDEAGSEETLGIVPLNDAGIAAFQYRMSEVRQKHRVKAQLMFEGEESGNLANFNPIYFNMRLLEKIITIANTGLVELIIRGEPNPQRTLQYGPFDHHLQDLRVPPAVILGRAIDEPSSTPIPHTEDYALKSGDWHFKPVRITTTTFNVELWYPSTPNITSTRTILVRWWAIPAQEQRREEPREPIRSIPTIVFDRQSYLANGTVRVTVTDADANRNRNDVDLVNVTVRSSLDPPPIMNVKCSETGPNTGVFVGVFETSGSPAAGKLHVRPGVFVNAEYLGASGLDRVTAQATIRPIIVGPLEPPSISIEIPEPGILAVSARSPDFPGDSLSVDLATSEAPERIPVTLHREPGTDNFVARLNFNVQEGSITDRTRRIPIPGLRGGTKIKAIYRYGQGDSEIVETEKTLPT